MQTEMAPVFSDTVGLYSILGPVSPIIDGKIAVVLSIIKG